MALKRITDLSAGTTPLTGAEEIPVEQGGDTVKVTAQDIADLAGGGSGTVESIVAGTGISVDDTDPANPIVSATGGGGGGSSPVSTISGTTYTVIASDEGKYLRFTSGSAKSATVDPESTTPLPDDGEWYFRNHGANDLTLIEGSGVTINPPAGGTLVVPSGGTVVLKRVAADEFDLSGQVSP